MNAADRGMALGLRALNRIAGLEVIDRIGMRDRAERIIYNASKSSFRATEAIARRFNGSGPKLDAPARQKPGTRAKLFDLTPSDEQAMMREAFGDFAIEKLRPAALEADDACAAPAELLEQANELGVDHARRPRGARRRLRGALGDDLRSWSPRRSPAATWGSRSRCSRPPRSAPRSASGATPTSSRPTSRVRRREAARRRRSRCSSRGRCSTRSSSRPRRDEVGDGYVLDGVKSLVPRAADAELFVVAAELDGSGPALFIVEAKPTARSPTRPSRRWASAPPAPASSRSTASSSRAGRLLADGDPDAYAECVRLARLAWCAVAVGTAPGRRSTTSIPYVNERVAFGEPISHRQAVAFNVANIAIELEGMRLAALRAASRADQGQDFAREVALARRLCATKGMQIGSDAVQLLGGHGYTKEHPVERWYRDLRAAGLMEGALLV